ncbi:uncharacterized protein LOC120191416 [Hibiscus syriacus]|uniref:uncharacterized protein LOC120116092 n=1 Tax=Hibiscus syriacus TaxID=106335 RepID=UPI001921252E|nr:uncharacterized protein LOC120116092 [Hibiscus syriacus]XP_039050296.1 uncharacterized protein LOC120191416 [Hibiscus syriacus]
MGQSTSSSGSTKRKDFDSVIEKCYKTYFKEEKDWTLAKFYRAVCETVEEINKKLGSTQLSIPKTTTLELAYVRYKDAAEGELSKDEFQEILQEVLIESGFSGIGAKDILMYLFGVPITALMLKRQANLKIHDDIFIPAVTSATVFLLAKLNKI